MSVMPPAEVETMSLIGLFGYPCAEADTAPTATSTMTISVGMSLISLSPDTVLAARGPEFTQVIFEGGLNCEARRPPEVLLGRGNIERRLLGMRRLARLDLVFHFRAQPPHRRQHIFERSDRAVADVENLLRRHCHGGGKINRTPHVFPVNVFVGHGL